MSRLSNDEKAIATLWKQHLRADFPAGLRGEEVAGSDMVMLDADIAGCVDTWLSREGPLDATRHEILRQCITELDNVLPLLTIPDEFHYYQRLHQLALLTSQSGEMNAK